MSCAAMLGCRSNCKFSREHANLSKLRTRNAFVRKSTQQTVFTTNRASLHVEYLRTLVPSQPGFLSACSSTAFLLSCINLQLPRQLLVQSSNTTSRKSFISISALATKNICCSEAFISAQRTFQRVRFYACALMTYFNKDAQYV